MKTIFVAVLCLGVGQVVQAQSDPGDDSAGLLGKSLDLVHQVENPTGQPLTDAQRVDLLTQAIKAAQQAPNHRLKGHRVLAIQAIRSAITQIEAGDPQHQVVTYLQTAETELNSSISLVGEGVSAPSNPSPAVATAPAAASTEPTPAASSDDIFDAAQNDDLDEVKSLIQQNPRLISATDKDGEMPLASAVSGGSTKVVEFLLASGADVNAGAKSGETALSLATDNKEMAALLLAKGAKIEARDDEGNTPLLAAATEGHRDVVELLLDHGANVEAADETGLTSLIWASIEGHKDVAEVLLAHKADVNAKNKAPGQTPLNSAAMNGHVDVAELLLAHGANLEEQDNKGWTSLDWAVNSGHLEMVKFLLDHGANIDAKAHNGATSLHLAEKWRNYDVATLLRQRGGREPDGSVSTQAFPKTGDAATDPDTLESAARAGDLAKVKALVLADPQLVIPSGDNEYSPLVAASWSRHRDIVEFLLSQHADINAKDSLDMTALAHAAQDGHQDMAEFLLANKADPNIGDRSGLTPLFYAALMDRKGMVELLLAHGANVNGAGKTGSAWTGDTPLYIAASNGAADVAKVLLAHGADPQLKGKDGLTPLQITIKNKHDTSEVPANDVADLLRPPVKVPPAAPVGALPPEVTPEMQQTFLTKFKAALEKQNPDALFSLVAVNPDIDANAKESFKGIFLMAMALTLSNPERTYSFIPLSPSDAKVTPTPLDGKMYDPYLPPVVGLKITFGTPAHPSTTEPVATGDTTMALGIQDHQLMFLGLKEIPGAVPPPAVDKAANFGVVPNLRKIDPAADDSDSFASLDQFRSSLKQPAVQILDSGETAFQYYAICRIAPNLCVWAGGDKKGIESYSYSFLATDSNKQLLRGAQKWVRLVDVPTDNGQAPNVQGTVFYVPDHYSGPITWKADYQDDAGRKSSCLCTINWQ